MSTETKVGETEQEWPTNLCFCCDGTLEDHEPDCPLAEEEDDDDGH